MQRGIATSRPRDPRWHGPAHFVRNPVVRRASLTGHAVGPGAWDGTAAGGFKPTGSGLIRMLVYRPSAPGSMRLAMLGKRFEP